MFRVILRDARNGKKRGLKKLRKLAEQGNVAAQTSLGWMYGIGAGVSQSDTESANWYQAAAEQGDAEAQNQLGLLFYVGKGVVQSETEAAGWFNEAAGQGYTEARFGLSCLR